MFGLSMLIRAGLLHRAVEAVRRRQPAAEDLQPWVCPNCHETNHAASKWCESCGESKPRRAA